MKASNDDIMFGILDKLREADEKGRLTSSKFNQLLNEAKTVLTKETVQVIEPFFMMADLYGFSIDEKLLDI